MSFAARQRAPSGVIQRCGSTPAAVCPCHAVPGIVRDVLTSPGEPLDAASRATFEPRFGHDFGSVRVHHDAMAVESARAIGADAYTLGTHIVFAANPPAPRVLAHELTHVVQQGFSATVPASLEVGGHTGFEDQADTVADDVVHGSTGHVPHRAHVHVQRQPGRGTAADAPRLEVRPTPNPPPCACIVFVHNNERNARLTAELMHGNCSYNLAIISPDDRQREMTVPRHAGTVDPNAQFPRRIAEECSADPQACRDFITTNARSTDPTVIEGVVHRQFFLAIHECSNEFALPVVALHNNAINDTAAYRARQAAIDSRDIQRGTFERNPPAQPPAGQQPQDPQNLRRPWTQLREWLVQNYGEPTTARLADRPRTTNIFRWCQSPDIGRCHVGDPAHPDTVTLVTNPADFERLRTRDVNVVLQTSAAAGGENAGDLSSLFLILRDVFQTRHDAVITQLEQGTDVEVDRIRALADELDRLREFGDETISNTLPRVLDMIRALLRILRLLLEKAAREGAHVIRLSRLRFVNIETPQSPTSRGQTAAQQRDESFMAILGVLRDLNIECCTDDAERQVRQGLR